MGKQRRAQYDDKRKRMLEADARRGVNKFGLTRQPSPVSRFKDGVQRTNVIGYVVNSKGKPVVGSRIYRTPTIKGHVMSEPLLGDSDVMQVSDMFLPRENVSPVVKQARRAKRLVTPSFERPPTSDCIMDLYPGERIVPHMYAEPMVYERRVFRSPQHRGHTAWTFSIGDPAIVVDKRNNMPLVKHRIKFDLCAGKLPPWESVCVDVRAQERASLEAMVEAWRGKINLDLYLYLTA